MKPVQMWSVSLEVHDGSDCTPATMVRWHGQAESRELAIQAATRSYKHASNHKYQVTYVSVDISEVPR